jgi:hypothetical protein
MISIIITLLNKSKNSTILTKHLNKKSTNLIFKLKLSRMKKIILDLANKLTKIKKFKIKKQNKNSCK